MCQQFGDPPEAPADLANPIVRREVYAIRAAVRSVKSALVAEAALAAVDGAKPGHVTKARVS